MIEKDLSSIIEVCILKNCRKLRIEIMNRKKFPVDGNFFTALVQSFELSHGFKSFLLTFNYNGNDLRPISKTFKFHENLTQLTLKLFSNIDQVEKIIFLSEGKECYLIGDIFKLQNQSLYVSGFSQKHYGTKSYIYLIGCNGNIKTLTVFAHLIEGEYSIILSQICPDICEDVYIIEHEEKSQIS